MKNWKTTLAGVIAAVGYALANLDTFTWKTALVAAALAIWGAVSKDFNISNAPSPTDAKVVE